MTDSSQSNDLPPVIDTTDKMADALTYWKSFTFVPHYLNLKHAMDNMFTDERAVEAKHEYAPRWVLVDRKDGKTLARFYTAGIWRWNSNLETGNYVPLGMTAPVGLAESRIQTSPNNLCQFSYALHTEDDKDLWAAQHRFQEYVTSLKSFNEHNKPRRTWQDGSKDQTSFILSSQMFVKRTIFTRKQEKTINFPLHQWVRDATKEGSPYCPNPTKPVVLFPRNGQLRPIEESSVPVLKLGDLVWFTFHVEFFIGTQSWGTTFIPREFVRVGRVSSELLGDLLGGGFDAVVGEDDLLGAGYKVPKGGDATNYPPSLQTCSATSETAVAQGIRSVECVVKSNSQSTSTLSAPPEQGIAKPVAITSGTISPERKIADAPAATNDAVMRWLETRCTSPDSVWGASVTTTTDLEGRSAVHSSCEQSAADDTDEGCNDLLDDWVLTPPPSSPAVPTSLKLSRGVKRSASPDASSKQGKKPAKPATRSDRVLRDRNANPNYGDN